MVIDVEDVVDQNRFSRVQWRLMLLVSCAVIADGFDIQAIAFVGPVLLKEWNLTRADLGPVIAAALIGMAIGAPLGGRLGDRFGRKIAMVCSTAFFGAATLTAALAADVNQLAVLRLVSGLGFGALLPNATALTAEWMPSRFRSMAIGVMMIGVPIGGMVGAAVASSLIATYGWRSPFVTGGLFGLLLSAVLLLALPESLRFLALRKSDSRTIARLLNRAFGPGFAPEDTYLSGSATGSSSWREIIKRPHIRATVGITLAFFANLMVFYAFANWVPTILTTVGMPLGQAIRGAFFFNLWGLPGAVLGTLLVARLGSRAGLMLILAGAIVSSAFIGYVLQHEDFERLAIMAGLSAAGAFVAGLQAALYSLAAASYPTACRSTGIGFAAGVGRLGPIASGFAGAFVLSLPGGPGLFFALVATVLLAAGIGVLIVDRHTAPTRTSRAVAIDH
jgi:AAHS family 4-hydroxybenzoate transporter-like MFS transporter